MNKAPNAVLDVVASAAYQLREEILAAKLLAIKTGGKEYDEAIVVVDRRRYRRG